MVPNGTCLQLRTPRFDLPTAVSKGAAAASWQLLEASAPALAQLSDYVSPQLPAVQCYMAERYLSCAERRSNPLTILKFVKDAEVKGLLSQVWLLRTLIASVTSVYTMNWFGSVRILRKLTTSFGALCTHRRPAISGPFCIRSLQRRGCPCGR